MTVVWPAAATTKATSPPAHKGGKMKGKTIKALPFVKEFADYFVRRAKRVLKLRNEDFKTSSIDVFVERGTIWVWFHNPDKIDGRAQFKFDGRCYYKVDYRLDKEKKK